MKTKHTGSPVRYKNDLYEVLAWDGDQRTRNQIHRASGPKATLVFWTYPEAKAWALEWMSVYKPAGEEGFVRLSSTTRHGQTATLERWRADQGRWIGPTEGAEGTAEPHASDFDSLQAALRHEQTLGAYLVVAHGSSRYMVLRPGPDGDVGHDLYFAHGKYHVKKESVPVTRSMIDAATPIDEFLRSGVGLVHMAAEVAPVLYEREHSTSPTRAKTNAAGLTYDEWYRAANAFGQRISPDKARKEWAANVDPSEWASRAHDADPPSAGPRKPLVWHRTRKGGLYAGSYEIEPSQGPRGGDGWWKVTRDKKQPDPAWFLVHKLSDAKEWAQKDFAERPLPPFDIKVRGTFDDVVPPPAPPSAGPAPIPPTAGQCVPFVKVTRDVERYEACLAQARAIGPIKDAETVYKLLHGALAKEDQEVFLVVLIDVREQLRGVAEVHRGARSSVMVAIQDVLRPVIVAGAEAFIVVHNHPSGKDAKPSDSDIALTKQIAKATKTFGKSMTFVDHVIISMREYYSFKKHDPSLFSK